MQSRDREATWRHEHKREYVGILRRAVRYAAENCRFAVIQADACLDLLDWKYGLLRGLSKELATLGVR